jgi:HAD superfamily hydrolase (TIGR01450 family)
VTGSARVIDGYDLVILDLDGVVFLIDKPIRGAVQAVEQVRALGVPVMFATNNASRRAEEVADLLSRMGVQARAEEVFTSAAAAARILAKRFEPGAPILVVGAEALREEVAEAGLSVVAGADAKPVAVVQGYGPDVGWHQLAEATMAVRGGALWVATNADRTLPSPRGALPGNGALLAVVATALARQPDIIVGKPSPALFQAAAHGHNRPLVVGDRLDTDIAGAHQAGLDSMLVLTGVSSHADLAAVPARQRPTYVARDLSGLFDEPERGDR